MAINTAYRNSIFKKIKYVNDIDFVNMLDKKYIHVYFLYEFFFYNCLLNLYILKICIKY